MCRCRISKRGGRLVAVVGVLSRQRLTEDTCSPWGRRLLVVVRCTLSPQPGWEKSGVSFSHNCSPGPAPGASKTLQECCVLPRPECLWPNVGSLNWVQMVSVMFYSFIHALTTMPADTSRGPFPWEPLPEEYAGPRNVVRQHIWKVCSVWST